MSLKYFKNNIILKPLTDGLKQDGIYLPQTSRLKVYEGIVQSCPLSEHNIKEGDRVIYENYAGFEIKYNGELFVIVASEDIIAKL